MLVGIYHGTKTDTTLKSHSNRPLNRQANFASEKTQENPKATGLDSPYRYDCAEVECTPLDDYVWRDNKDFRRGTYGKAQFPMLALKYPTSSYSQVAEYGRLAGPRPVKTFVMNMTSQNWLTGYELLDH